MSVRDDLTPPAPRQPEQAFNTIEQQFTKLIYLDGEKIAYVVILTLAILTRFWDLGARVMSHDESLHTRFSWDLYQGSGFAHTPLMHGPLLFHATAFFYLLFGDNDFTARIYPALLGVLLVMTPWFMRKWLGKYGTIATSILLLISPMILYYSRYIRHDIPSIIAAVVIAISIWRYMELRKLPALLWIAGAQAVMFASKEVSFIYIAIFGSFLTIFFLKRLFDVRWQSIGGLTFYGISLMSVLFTLGLTVLAFILNASAAEAQATGLPLSGLQQFLLQSVAIDGIDSFTWGVFIRYVMVGLASISVVLLSLSVIIGQWKNLRSFPELDLMIVMGMLVLPSLAPLLSIVSFIDWVPLSDDPVQVARSIQYTLPFVLVSVVVGIVWGMRKPQRRVIQKGVMSDEALAAYDINENGDPVYPLDGWDWIQAIIMSRAVPILAIYWVITIFFFTTMFSNGPGIGTGVLGSLAYWLDQHGVQRGGQPWYYYILIQVPIYEYLPALLTLAAGIISLGSLFKANKMSTSGNEDDEVTAPKQKFIDLDAPLTAPVLLFTGYWAVMNVAAYSISGEKMPWLTTHLTVPFCILGGWAVGRLLTRIDWQQVWHRKGWLTLLVIPVLLVALLRVFGPLCNQVPLFPACNSFIPEQYQAAIFAARTTEALGHTSAWIAAILVLAGAVAGVTYIIIQSSLATVLRLSSLTFVGVLAFMTARVAWQASYINYDLATEHLVYAHSSGSVKEMLDQIEELSLKTTDGYDLKIGYDNRVSWPMSWYFRDYNNAVYFGEDPNRSAIGDAAVVVAGPDNWTDVERVLGNRYYRFEYIRMWWPIEDYKNQRLGARIEMGEADFPQVVIGEDLSNIVTDRELQRGLWDIWLRRDYDRYAQAVADYRGGAVPSYELNEWPVADRMRFYIRKDIYAQVWEYGVAASELADIGDPYAEIFKEVEPVSEFGAGLLQAPRGLSIGLDGNIYVADSVLHQVIVFSPEGDPVNRYGQQGFAPEIGVLNEPWDVSVNPDGRVYVADTWNGRVSVFEQDGTPLQGWGVNKPDQTDDPVGFWGPRGIVIDGDGDVFVADTGNKRIQRFLQDGSFVYQIGTSGSDDGQLNEPVGVAIGPDDLLYVADTWNQRIQVFDQQGTYIREWLVDAWYVQSEQRPYLAVDDEGRVYMTDPDASRVVVFSAQGEYLFALGDFETNGIISGIAVDEDSLYITDALEGTILRYDLNALLED